MEPFKDSPVQQIQVPIQQTVQQTVPVQQTQVPIQQPVQTVQQPVQTQPVQTAVPVAEKTYTLEDFTTCIKYFSSSW